MKGIDLLIAFVAIALVLFSVGSFFYRRKKGAHGCCGCSGDCSHCETKQGHDGKEPL